MNFILLCLHVIAVGALTLLALRAGIESMIAWLSILALSMNLFVLKQTTILGLNATCSDALAVGYLLGLNLIQEFFGKEWGRKCLWIAFSISCAFVLLSKIQLLYLPHSSDWASPHFSALLDPMPRITLASLASFLVMQLIDMKLFAYLRTKSAGNYFALRQTAALLIAQTVDTVLFSILGLLGLVHSITHIICVSLTLKVLVILLSTPFILLAKKVVKNHV